MNFLSLIFALLLDQWRSGSARKHIVSSFLSYADSLERHFNTGIHRHGIIAWVAAAGPFLVLSLLVYYLLYGVSPLLAWAWNVAILYLHNRQESMKWKDHLPVLVRKHSPIFLPQHLTSPARSIPDAHYNMHTTKCR